MAAWGARSPGTPAARPFGRRPPGCGGLPRPRRLAPAARGAAAATVAALRRLRERVAGAAAGVGCDGGADPGSRPRSWQRGILDGDGQVLVVSEPGAGRSAIQEDVA